MDVDTAATLNIGVIVIEPLQWLARYHLRSASMPRRYRRRSRGEPAPIAELASAELGPFNIVSEYYTMVPARGPQTV